MRITTLGSILILGVAGAAIAQVSQAPRRGGMGNHMMNNGAMMNNMMMNDMAPMNGMRPMRGGMSNGSDAMPGNMVGSPTEEK